MFSVLHLKTLLLFCLLLLQTNPAWAFEYLQPLPKSALIPLDNPITEAKVLLGKQLFFDQTILGKDSVISCNSCHNLFKGGTDNLSKSIGQDGQYTKRSTPGLWNIGLQTVLYWDGRSTSLENQILDHLRDTVISKWKNLGELITHLNNSEKYRRSFSIAFNIEPNTEFPISARYFSQAIASFERSLMTPNSSFDRYISGEKMAISESAKRGLAAFREAECLACHFGVNFAAPAPGPALKMGDGFYELFPNDLGTIYDKRYNLTDDLGRYEYSGLPGERYMWRVPLLRNIELTAPYFHNGSVATLDEAIKIMAKTQVGKDLSPSTIKDIAEFLKSLTGKFPEIKNID